MSEEESKRLESRHEPSKEVDEPKPQPGTPVPDTPIGPPMELEPAEGAEVVEDEPDDILRDSYNFHEEVDEAMGAENRG